jgi:hypothetical protein
MPTADAKPSERARAEQNKHSASRADRLYDAEGAAGLCCDACSALFFFFFVCYLGTR